MSILTDLWHRIVSLTRSSREDREMDEELRFHLEMETEKNVTAGMSPGYARRQAHLRFGSVDRYAEEVRDARGTRSFEDLWRDARIAVRALRKRPGYLIAFVVTLGLGIGANTAIFSLIRGVVLKPLPHQASEQLVYLRHAAPLVGVENALFSVPEIRDVRQRSDVFAEVAELSTLTFTLIGLGEPRLVQTGIVTGNYFEVMGLQAVLGRVFTRHDDGEAAAPVMMLSHDFWGRVFGFDPSVIGRTYQMNGRSVEIVGVLTPAPPYPEATDLFVNMVSSPHHLEATMTTDRIHRMTEVFARLVPDASVEMAQAEMATVGATIRRDHPEAYDEAAGYDIAVTGLQDQLTQRARPTLWILFGTAGFVLIIACANVANLTLTRVVTRGRELATRAALGATRGTLRRALIAENLLLSVAGAGLGLGVAWLGLDALVAFAERYTNRASEVTLDGTVLVFAIATATVAALLFAALPRLPDGGGTHPSGSASGGRATDGTASRRVQGGLVVAQVAVSFVLLVGAGLLGRTFLAVQAVDPGFETDDVLTMEIPTALGSRTFDQARTYYEEILRQVQAIPGVEAAGLGTTVPLTSERNEFPLIEVTFEGYDIPPGQPSPRVDFRPITPDYFQTLGIELLAGRRFEPTDGPDTRKVVVITRSVADRYFADRTPIGARLMWSDPLMSGFLGDEWRTIVGVVEDSRNYGLDREVPVAVFQPFAQMPLASSLFVRTAGDPQMAASPIRDIIRRLDATQPIENVTTLERIRSESLTPRRLNATLIGGFALLALVIAAVGVFSVLAFSVTQRTREFGIRSALGAERAVIARTVLRDGLRLAVVGLGVGGVAAAALSRSLQGLLYGVSVGDPITYAAVGCALAGVAGAAAWLPARRAAGVDPTVALRAE